MRCILILLLALSNAAFAKEMSVQDFVDIEIKVREITLDQLNEKVTGVETDRDYRKEINSTYDAYGTTSGEHIRYSNQHQEEIKRWYIEYPEDKDYLNELQKRFDDLVRQIGE
jgi:hypothetical protein